MDIKFKKIKKEDCNLLYKWVNDKEVRENSFKSELIEYEDHKKWFVEKLRDKNVHIFIAYLEDIPIGQLRIDVQEEVGLINYSIESSWRGKGYGLHILRNIINIIKEESINISKLIGRVKYKNIASQKIFIKAGYIGKYKKDYIEYSTDIR